MGFDPPPEVAGERDADGRLFVVLALLAAVAAIAGYPYVLSYARQDVDSDLLARMPAAVAIPILVVAEMAIVLPSLMLGLRLGPKIGLGVPLLRAWIERMPAVPSARSTLRAGALAGLTLGALFTIAEYLPFLDFEEKLARAGRIVPTSPPVWAGVLGSFSAGVIEEVILRFGLFTLVAWTVARLARAATPSSAPPFAFHTANVVAALVFATLHFSNADAIGLPLDATTIAFILGANGAVGLWCGWLYWKRGLEAAMTAHVVTDLVIHALVPALAPRP